MELLRVAALGFRLAGILVCRKGARVVCTVDAAATARVGLQAMAS
jgi:hypothetical protein